MCGAGSRTPARLMGRRDNPGRPCRSRRAARQVHRPSLADGPRVAQRRAGAVPLTGSRLIAPRRPTRRERLAASAPALSPSDVLPTPGTGPLLTRRSRVHDDAIPRWARRAPASQVLDDAVAASSARDCPHPDLASDQGRRVRGPGCGAGSSGGVPPPLGSAPQPRRARRPRQRHLRTFWADRRPPVRLMEVIRSPQPRKSAGPPGFCQPRRRIGGTLLRLHALADVIGDLSLTSTSAGGRYQSISERSRRPRQAFNGGASAPASGRRISAVSASGDRSVTVDEVDGLQAPRCR